MVSGQLVEPLMLTWRPAAQSRHAEPAEGLCRPGAQPMHLSEPQFAVSVHVALSLDLPLEHSAHAWVVASK